MRNPVVDRGYAWRDRLYLNAASGNLNGVDGRIRFCNRLDTCVIQHAIQAVGSQPQIKAGMSPFCGNRNGCHV